MKKMLLVLAVAAMSLFAQGEEGKEKKKMPSSMKSFTSLVAAKKEAEKYEAPIFVVAVAKGTPMESAVKKMMSNKFFKELATKGFFVYTMRLDLSKKEKESDGRTPKAMYEKLSDDERALLDVIAPPDQVMVRRLPLFGMVSPDATKAIIKPVDIPKLKANPDSNYYGQYLQDLQSAAMAYGIEIEMSKEMRKYVENPPAEKKDKRKKK